MKACSTAEIREAGTGDYAYQLVPWHVLLDRLEAAEQTIKAASELSVFNSGLGYVFCRELNAALNRSKS